MELKYFVVLMSVMLLASCGEKKNEAEIKRYIGKHVYAAAFNDELSVVEKKPGGRDIAITHDPFLNTYTVSGTAENGEEIEYKYKLAGFDSLLSKEYFKQYPGTNYYIANEIEKNNRLTFIKKRKFTDENYSYSGVIIEDIEEAK